MEEVLASQIFYAIVITMLSSKRIWSDAYGGKLHREINLNVTK
ncbi:hypothetical protein [Nostoc sp. CALU 1950]